MLSALSNREGGTTMETYYKRYRGRTGTYYVRMTDQEIEFREKLEQILSVLLLPPVFVGVCLIASGVIKL